MIQFLSSVDQTEHKVVFSPRLGTSLGAKEIRRQLIYGYRCPFCRNPILFAFWTPEKVTLKRYEETRVVNGAQEFHMRIPSPESTYDTAYHIDFIRIPGQKMGLQRVSMINHIVPEKVLGKADSVSQKGPRCCPFAAVSSLRKESLIRDSMVAGGLSPSMLKSYFLPNWEEFEEIMRSQGKMFFLQGIGGLPLVGCRSDFISQSAGYGHWTGLMQDRKRPMPKVCAAQNCHSMVSPEDPFYATPCGTFCNRCFLTHIPTCNTCALGLEERSLTGSILPEGTASAQSEVQAAEVPESSGLEEEEEEEEEDEYDDDEDFDDDDDDDEDFDDDE